MFKRMLVLIMAVVILAACQNNDTTEDFTEPARPQVILASTSGNATGQASNTCWPVGTGNVQCQPQPVDLGGLVSLPAPQGQEVFVQVSNGEAPDEIAVRVLDASNGTQLNEVVYAANETATVPTDGLTVGVYLVEVSAYFYDIAETNGVIDNIFALELGPVVVVQDPTPSSDDVAPQAIETATETATEAAVTPNATETITPAATDLPTDVVAPVVTATATQTVGITEASPTATFTTDTGGITIATITLTTTLSTILTATPTLASLADTTSTSTLESLASGTASVVDTTITEAPTTTPSITPTNTLTATSTDTPSRTPTHTATFTPSNTPTNTATFTPSVTPTPTGPTPTFTPFVAAAAGQGNVDPTVTLAPTIQREADATLTPFEAGAPLVVLTAAGEDYLPAGVVYCETLATESCVSFPASPDSPPIQIAQGATITFKVVDERPESITFALATRNALEPILEATRTSGIGLFDIDASTGQYLLSVEVVWEAERSTYFFEVFVTQ